MEFASHVASPRRRRADGTARRPIRAGKDKMAQPGKATSRFREILLVKQREVRRITELPRLLALIFS